MAKLKDRRAAHRLVADLICRAMPSLSELGTSAEVIMEVEHILKAHFSAGATNDELPDDFDVPEAGTLAMGGVSRCSGCGVELSDKSKRLCAACESKVEPETKNGEVKAA